MNQKPELQNQDQVRWGLRISGLLVASICSYFFIKGIIAFAHMTQTDDTNIPTGIWQLFGVLGIPVGLGLLKAGFLNKTAKYFAGETLPVAKSGLDYLAEPATSSAANFCSNCGEAVEKTAKFCVSCGKEI